MLNKSLLSSFCALSVFAVGCGNTSGGTVPPPDASASAVPNPAKAGPDPSLNGAQNEQYKRMAATRSLMDQHYRQNPMGPTK